MIEGEYETSLDDTEAQVSADAKEYKQDNAAGSLLGDGGTGTFSKDTSSVEPASPVVTYAQAADAIAKAKDMDVLELAGDYINMVHDADQRAELGTLYKRKFDELKG